MKNGLIAKIILFVLYHVLVYRLMFYVISTHILPLFTNWWSITSYIGNFIQFIILISFILATLLSIWSCFFNDTLKETDLCQWIFNGWMPYWGKNQFVGKGGFIFTGLPSYIIDLRKFDGTKKTEDKTFAVQVEIDGDPNGTKFQAEIHIRFIWYIINTYLFIKNPSKITDLHNVIIKKITEWLNDSSNKYKNVKDLKCDITRIQEHIKDTLSSDISIYGIDITCFSIVDIELPENVIDQQNQNDAARRKQTADDEREYLDNKALLAQAKQMVRESKKINPACPLTLKEALGIVQVQRGHVTARQMNINDDQNKKGGKGRKGRGLNPTVLIDTD